MNEPDSKDVLELEVKDFGPIVDAKIELRPLTVFVGPSNTGKSYLAILIYALHRFFGGDPRFAGRLYPSSPFFDRWTEGLHEESIYAFFEEVRSLMTPPPGGQDKTGIVLPARVTDALRSAFDENADALAGEIRRCFGIGETAALTRRGRTNGAHMVIQRRTSGDSALVEHRLTLARKTKLRTTIPEEMTISLDNDADDESGRYRRRIMRYLTRQSDIASRRIGTPDLLTFFSDMVLPYAVGPLRLPAYYLPADRTGVIHAHSVVVSALISSAPMAGLRPAARTPMLSGVLADFLQQLIEIGRSRRARRRPEQDLGAMIENDVLGGTVLIDRSPAIDYPRFSYRPEGWKDNLALANASSMVSELAPVVLYLRHLIEPGNVLIVEEPESHLHPGMQVVLTKQLAKLVNAGVRVIVTTHSEWLLEELANIVRRSELPAAERGDLPGGNIALRAEQVGAWLFEPKERPKGSVVKEVRLDDSGSYSAGYDAVATALHNDWAELSSRIEADS